MSSSSAAAKVENSSPGIWSLRQKVAVVERRWVGGSCPAVACMPSKNELWSARVIHLAHNAAHFGALDEIRTDMRGVRRRKQDMIDREIALHLSLPGDRRRAHHGQRPLHRPETLEVALNEGGTRVLVGDELVINVGSRAAIPDFRACGTHTRSPISRRWTR